MEPADAGDSKSRPLRTCGRPRPRREASHDWRPSGIPMSIIRVVSRRQMFGVPFQGEWIGQVHPGLAAATDGQLPTCLTRTPKGVVEYRWSPDGAEIAFTTPETVDDDTDPIEVDRRHRRNRLWIVQLSNAAARAVTSPDQHVVEMAWSPDKKEFAVVAAPDDGHDAILEKATLVIVNSETGSNTRTLRTNVGDREGLTWSPDGKTITFIDFAPKHFASARPGLLRDGRLSDLHRNGEVYHISSKGRDTARQIREQIDRGERPDYSHIERTTPDLLGEMREDFGKHPVIREMILLDSEDDCYNGRGVFS